MSIIKTAFFFLILISITMGGIYVKGSASSSDYRMEKIAPIIIGNKGAIRFPQRLPLPETVFQIQSAIQTDDVQTLNKLLVEHHFYVLPGRRTD